MSDDKEGPKSGVGGPKSEDSKTVTRGEKAPSPKVEGREGPRTNSPRDTLPRIGYRHCQVKG